MKYGEKSSLSSLLDETSPVKLSKINEMFIMNGPLKTPWRLFLKSNGEQSQVDSNTATLGKVKFRSADRKIQEDAMFFNFIGGEQASVEINSNFTEDKIAYIESKAALSFDIKIDHISATPFLLEMTCEQGCGGAIDMTETLNKMTKQQWHTVTIDLRCFEDKGVDFARVTSPFKLTTQGEASMTVADIKFVPHAGSEAMLVCNPKTMND